LNLTLADIASMPQTSVYASLVCVGPPSLLVTAGNWTGVKLQLLLQEAGILPETAKVAFYAQDGYTTDLSLDMAQRDDVILAYEKDGAPLGEVLRLVVPGCWGYKWIAEVTDIDLVNYDFLGKYESIGYPDEAYVTDQTASQIYIPWLTPYLGSNLAPSPSFSPSPSPAPSNFSSLSPTNFSSPIPSNFSSPSPPQTQNPHSDSFLPMDVLYGTAVAVLIIVFIPAAIMLRKRTKQKTS
jgi:hypothetical protein